mmetsp:Transcript_103915/g.190299  ORF Transcript_103915/g.190299 Transcript_103915/m.190299 type:complete len:103 (+) Transcript_103915:710-1018(+)
MRVAKSDCITLIYLNTRRDRSRDTCSCRKYLRSSQKALDCLAPKLRKFVIAPVMLLTNDEKITKAKSRTKTAKILSRTLYGFTEIDAGVNCVSDQCKAVAYW